MASSMGPHFQFEVQLPSNISRATFSALLEKNQEADHSSGPEKSQQLSVAC